VPRPASEGGPVDKVTGKKVFVPTGKSYVNKDGKVVTKKSRFDKLALTDDAHSLVSKARHPTELVYANHSNQLKGLANQARKEAISVRLTPYSPSAKVAYANEVAALKAKVNIAKKNAPLERQAQAVANQIVSQKRQANPDMDASEIKKIKGKALTEARIRTGAHKDRIYLTTAEWNAIQAGAISNNMLKMYWITVILRQSRSWLLQRM
jgi:hypothetical protein